MTDQSQLKPLHNFDAEGTCFACGSHNTAGLHMDFKSDGKTVFSWLKVPRHLCGWQNVIHGGIIATILDEIMSWTGHHLIKKLILTRSISIEFLQPVYVDTNLRAEGSIHRLNSERQAELKARLVNEKEKVCAQATGSFALLTPKIARRLGVIDDTIVMKFERFLNEPTNTS